MEEKVEKKEPGFFKGFWHGLIAPFKLFVKIFKPGLKVIDTKDKSNKYKAGLFLGLLSIFSGGGHHQSSKHKKKSDEINKGDNRHSESQ